MEQTDREFYDITVGKSSSIRAIYDAMNRIDNPDDAKRFFNGYVDYIHQEGKVSQEEAVTIAKANLGWMFGEGMPPKRITMWHEATGAMHPLGFGT